MLLATALLIGWPVDCPKPGTAAADRAIAAGDACDELVAWHKQKQAKDAARPNPAPPSVEPKPSGTPTDKFKELVRQKLDVILFDGASARFLWPDHRDTASYCGFVNAKNRFGGYVGWKIFFVIGIDSAKNPMVVSVTLDDEDGVARTMCQRGGFSLSPPS